MFPLALGLLILLAYWTGLRSFFHADDFVLLSEAQLARSVRTLVAVDPNWFFYRPLGKLLWLVEYRLFGIHALLYHLVSLGLHWLNALLLVALVRRIAPAQPGIGLLAGALFALLPLHVETVVWLACQYDLLATCGGLLALIGLLAFWQERRTGLYALSLVTYQLALWSKESAFTLPALALILGLAQPGRPRLRVLLAGIVPYGLLLGINLLQRYLVWGSLGGYSAMQAAPLSPWTRLTNTLATLAGPLNRLVFPGWLVVSWQLTLAILIGVGLLLARRRRVLVVGVLWLTITLIPIFSLLPVGDDLQNSRVLYLPSVGFCLALVALIDGLIQRAAPHRYLNRLLMAGGLLCGAYLAVLPFQVQPWAVAGQETIHIAQELHRLIPGFPPGSKVQMVGLPDNYKGAYIYRLGLNHATGHLYQTTFLLETLTQLPPFDYTNDGGLYQVEFAFDRTTEHWQITHAQSVTPPDGTMASTTRTGGWRTWDMTGCPGEWVAAVCESGMGVKLEAGARLAGPPLALAAPGWVEVSVGLLVLRTAEPIGKLRLGWRLGGDISTNERTLEMNLPGDGSYRHYHFFIPPDPSGQPIRQLWLDLEGGSGQVVVRNIALRTVP